MIVIILITLIARSTVRDAVTNLKLCFLVNSEADLNS